MASFFNTETSSGLWRSIVVYVGGAWLLIEITEFLVEQYGFSRQIIDISGVLIIAGLISLVLNRLINIKGQRIINYAWEMVLHSLIFIISLVLVYQIASNSDSLRYNAAPQENSIAVFTFDNFSSNDDNRYFAAGITEAIRVNLGQITQMKVISRNSIEKFEKLELTTPEIASKLGVKYVLDGSIQQIADQIRINIQLLSADKDVQLWSESYDRSFNDILQIQTDIAADVAKHLQITTSNLGNSVVQKINNQEAYYLYLQAKEIVDYPKGHRGEFTTVIQLLDSVLVLEPGFPPAYVAKAKAYLNNMYYGRSNVNDIRGEVLDLLMKAMESGYGDSDARAILGTFYFNDTDFEKAEKYLLEAIEINPNNALAYNWLGLLYTIEGKNSDSQFCLRKAIELDPLNYTYQTDQISLEWYIHGQTDKTITELKELYATSKHDYTTFVLAQIYCTVGQYEKTIELMSSRDIPGAETNWLLGYAYGMTGNREKALISLNYNLNKREKGYVGGYFLCILYTGLKEYEKAMDWLEVEYEEGPGYIFFFALKMDVKVNPLVDNPRFQALLDKMPFERKAPAINK